MGDESDDRDHDNRDHTEDNRDRDRSPLIKERLDAGMFGRLPQIDPHCTYVLAYGGGELRAFSHKPRFGDRAGTNRCYVVDTSPRSSRGTLKVPARGGRYFFDAIYDAQWRVADPVQVVRDNVDDGHNTVAGFLQSQLGPIGRQFDPDDAEGFENHIYNRLGAAAEAPGLPVGNGLGLTALTVVVTSDPRVIDRGVELDDDVHEGTLTERRTMRLQHLLHGDGSAITYHLAQNPKDTHTVLQMITDARDKNERLRLEWLDRMRDDDAIQEADYEAARAVVLGGGSASPPALNVGFEAWPNEPPPIIDGAPPTAPQRVRVDNPSDRHPVLGAAGEPGEDDDGRLWFRAQTNPEIGLGRTSDVLVTLGREALRIAAGPARSAATFIAGLDEKITIEMVPVANLAVVGSDKVDVHLPAPGEPHRLRFTVRATHPGPGELWVIASQHQVPLRTLQLTPTVTDTQCVDGGEILLRQPSTPVHVLRIIEQRQGDVVRYRYDIEARDLGLLNTYNSESIDGDRDAYVRALYTRIERFWVDTNGDLKRFQEELRAFGAEMLDQLVPPELQAVLWEHRHQLRNVMVLSTEPFIPWELLHLTDPKESTLLPEETAFLGQQGVVRWRWRHWPQEQLRLRYGLARVIAPDYPEPYKLDQATSERQYLREMFGAEDVEPHHASVLALLRSGAFDLLHFVGHGAASIESIADAQLLLEGALDTDGQYRSEPLRVSVVARNVRCDRSGGGPIVFLNACQTGRLGQQLTSIGGFAQAFLDAGAGIFVSSLWSVGDTPAKEFAVAFYEALRNGRTASEAAATGRAAARKAGDATWLAYAVYAHPAARVSLDQSSGTPRAPRDVRAARLADGSVLVQWRDVGDVEYRVRRQLDDGRWQVVAHTTDTFMEDDEAPPGAVRVYAVSAITGGLRSRESHSSS